MNNAQQIAFLIKQLTKDKNITIKQLLENCELNINTISELAKGKQLSYVNFAKIADYLGVSVDYLLGRTDTPNPSTENNNVTLSSDQNRLLQMYALLSDMEKGEILGELKAMTANKRPIQTIRAVARSVDNRPPRLITGDFSDILDAPDISDKY